jgi:hypothetical protein
MVFARIFSLIAVGACLAGCAIPSTNFSRDPATQAALARCRAQLDSQPASSSNPFAEVADQNQYVIDCMKRAGYEMQ